MTVPCVLAIVAAGYAAYSILMLPAVAVMLWCLSRRQENRGDVA